MALLFCDSFSHYQTAQALAKWSAGFNALIDTTAGRRGDGALDLSQPFRTARKALTPATTHEFVIGAAIKLVRATDAFLAFGVTHGGGNPQVGIVINRDRSVYVSGGGTIMGAVGTRLSPNSDILLPADQAYYVELAGIVSVAFGVFNLKINGVTVLEGINAATSPGNADQTWGQVFCSSGMSGQLYVSDLYVLDTSGSVNNAPLGDVRVDARFPVGPGTVTGTDYDAWFSAAGSNKNGGAYTAIDEVPPDTTTFVVGSCGHQGAGAAGGGGFPETPTMQVVALKAASAADDPILCLQLCAYIAKSPGDVGNQVKAQFIQKQATVAPNPAPVPDLIGTAFEPSTTYGFQLLPIDGPLTTAEYQATEYGLARADAQSGPVTSDTTPPGVAPGGAPTISGLSVASAPRCGGAEVTVTGTFLPVPFDTDSRFRIYLRVTGSVATWDVPCKVSPNDASGGVPGHYNTVKVLIPGGKYFNEATLSSWPCVIVAVNSLGEATFAFALTTETAGLSQLVAELIQPQDPITVDTADQDFLGACREPSTEIANLALSHLGINKHIDSVLLDNTAESIVVRLHYARVVNAVLRAFTWPFATRYETLTLVDGDETTPANNDWQYSYRAPSDNIFARRILGVGKKRTPDPNPPRFRVGSDLDGPLVYTNEPDAELEYTARTSCPALYGDALFLEALEWRLAWAIGPALAKDQKLVDNCLRTYELLVGRARVVGANEGEQDDNRVDPDWISGRG